MLNTLIGISVIIPVKNRYSQVQAAVHSASVIDAVTEIVVIDDGSTPEVSIDMFSKEEGNSKIQVLKNVHLSGAQGARLTGVIASKNEIVLFLDSDDLLLEDGVARLFLTIKDDPDLALVYSNIIRGAVKSDFTRVSGRVFRDVLRNLSLCPFSGLMVRKSLIAWECLDLCLPAWQDDDLCLVAARDCKVKYVDTPAAAMEVSADSISRSRFKQVIGLAMLLEKWKHDILEYFGPGHLLLWRIRLLSTTFYAIADELKFFRRERKASNLIIVAEFGFKVAGKVTRLACSPYFERINA